jgi:hypothetical protein
MWHVWLVWILTTKRKSLKRVENLERYVIFTCYYLLILSIKRFLCCCVHLLSRFILQTVLLSRYLSSSICSALNPDCSFVFEWPKFLGIWNDAQIFVFVECTFVSIQLLLLMKVWASLLTCIEQWWWRSSVAAFVLQLLFSQLRDQIRLILLVAAIDKALNTVLVVEWMAHTIVC